MLRLGTYELRSSRDRTPGTRRRFAGAADCLAFLRSYRVDAAKARALVRSASTSVKSDGDALGALAQLLYRGDYVVYQRAPVRVPMLELPPAPIEDDRGEPEFEEKESEGKPA